MANRILRAYAAFMLLMVGSLFIPLESKSATILFPPFRTALTDKFATVVLKSVPNENIAWQHIRSNGVLSGQSRSDKGGVFSINLELEPGVNRVTVEGDFVELFYDDGSNQIPPGFVKRSTHSGDISSCSDCHDPLTNALLEKGYPGVCLACHIVVSQNQEDTRSPTENPHFRSVTARCGNCHEPHYSTNPKLVDPKVAKKPCAGCHKDKYVGEESHKAFEEGGCAACHDTHYSGFPKHLRSFMPGTCNECHNQGVNIQPKEAHPPKEKSGETCDRCHNPHTNSAKLLIKPTKETCAACHPKVLSAGHGAELAECGKCHDPHKALGTGLLRKDFPAGCEECHDDIRVGKRLHKPVFDGCSKCHAPHSDNNRQKALDMCVKCHDMKKGTDTYKLHGGLAMDVSKCGMCHNPHSSDQTSLLKMKTHFPLTQAKCDACHGSGASAKMKVPANEMPDRCGKCHSMMRDLAAKGARIHDPVKEGDCIACHDPHMSKNKAYLKAPMQKVCGDCHEEGKAGQDKKLHPAAETCTDCHLPHGGELPKFLKAKPPKLCLDCHDDPSKGKKMVHGALDEGCTVCHDAHSGYGKGLVKKKDAALCLDCHKNPAAGAKTPHPAMDEGCVSCHSPHGSDQKKLLKKKGNDLCIDCHENPAAGGNAHPALDEGCTSCHKPHGSEAKKLLPMDATKLCLTCHDDPSKGKKIIHAALDEGCTSCHNPHVGKTGKLLVKPVNEVCAACHDKLGPKHHVIDGSAAGSYPKNKGVFPLSGGKLACTGCHAPHAANEGKLYVRPEADICSSCH